MLTSGSLLPTMAVAFSSAKILRQTRHRPLHGRSADIDTLVPVLLYLVHLHCLKTKDDKLWNNVICCKRYGDRCPI